MTKPIRPDFETEHDNSGKWRFKRCKNCGDQLECEFIKNIWKHMSEHNYYNCISPEPISKKLEAKFSNLRNHDCKLHNYEKSKKSDAVICSKCGDVIHKRDFFTNRDVYWCRLHNMKFTNIRYHEKKYHTLPDGTKTVMDYIEYHSDFEPKPKDYEYGKRRWSKSGHGLTHTMTVKRDRFDFHVIDYGFISKTKFAKIIAKIIHAGSHSSMLDFIMYAGNDIKFFKPDEKELIYFIKRDMVWMKFDHYGKLVWISPEFTKSQKDELKKRFKNYTETKTK